MKIPNYSLCEWILLMILYGYVILGAIYILAILRKIIRGDYNGHNRNKQ